MMGGFDIVGNPIGFAAFAAIPLVILFHLFRQRYRPKRIAGLFLWGDAVRDRSGGRRRHRLENSLSLWLELLLAALLATCLLDLRIGAGARARNLVIVLDGSASLSAKTPRIDVAERARHKISELIDRNRIGTRVTIVESGSPPLLLVGPAAAPGVARNRLASWTPARRDHDIAEAVSLARELAGPEGRVHLVSDRIVRKDAAPSWLAQHAIGTALENTAILGAARSRQEGTKDRIFVQLVHFGSQTHETVLEIRQKGQVVHREALTLPPAQPRRLSLSLTLGEQDCELRLPEDALDVDNHALLLRPPRRLVHCRNLLPEESAPFVARALGAIPDCEIVSGETPADLEFRTQLPRKTAQASWICLFGTRGPEAKELHAPFFVNHRHPLMSGTSFESVSWSGAGLSRLPGLPLVSLPARDLLSIEEDSRTIVHCNIDLARSDLSRSADWPILMDNLVEMRRQALPGSATSNLRLGASLRFTTTDALAPPLIHRGPQGGERELPARGRLLLSGFDRVGIHEILRGERVIHRVSVNFNDPRESDLRGAREAEALAPEGSEARRSAEAPDSSFLQSGLIAAAILIFLANAWLLSRREGR